MKAMLLRAQGSIDTERLALAEVPDPQPGLGQVRLRVSACGLCHTDLHIIEGDLPVQKLPLIPGHQIVGMVDAAGPGTGILRFGDRVGVPWLHSTCGECRFCKSGRENLCVGARFTGYQVDGGYAQLAVVPEDFVCRLPEGFTDVQAAPLLCGGIIGYRALHLSELEPGGRLGLYGFGASAHIAIQVALHWGCRVYVFTRSPQHQALARSLGAAWAGRAEDEPPDKLDSAVIFAPSGGLVPLALQALDRGGTLVLSGIHMSPIPQMDYRLIYHERTVRSVANFTRQDAQQFLELAARIPVHIEVQTFALEEANRALKLLKQGRVQGAGVLVIPRV